VWFLCERCEECGHLESDRNTVHRWQILQQVSCDDKTPTCPFFYTHFIKIMCFKCVYKLECYIIWHFLRMYFSFKTFKNIISGRKMMSLSMYTGSTGYRFGIQIMTLCPCRSRLFCVTLSMLLKLHIIILSPQTYLNLNLLLPHELHFKL
jgi:hypothetical protein